MKKLLTAFLSVFILALSISNSYAATLSTVKDIKYAKSGGQDKISLYSASYKGFSAFYLQNPDRLVVDVPNNTLGIKGTGTLKTNGSAVKSIRYSQFSKTAVRVVFDLTGKQPYTVDQKNGCLTFIFGKAAASQTKPVEASRGDTVRPPVVVNKLSYSSTENTDKITVAGSSHDGYSAVRLTNPDRIVVDIPNCTVPQDQKDIPGNMGLVKNISYTQLNATTARIVAETNGQPQYALSGEGEQLLLSIESPALKNILYSVQGETASLVLKNTRLEEILPAVSTEGAADGSADMAIINPLYSVITDAEQKNCKITFPTSLADLGSGTLQINDGVLNSVNVSYNTDTRDTEISFNSNSPHIFDITYNPQTNDTEINILKPFSKTDKLVVIDPGHGGSDPGASYAGVIEKDLNLKIALKLNDILKNRGINTYMTRTDDTFIPLYDRANIANDLNASFFLSIHNNAFNTSEHGTETLCYPSGKSRQFASIVQKNLIGALGTRNIGIIDRPNLVVLHATKMPAALAEIAYITNTEDRKKLLDDAFLDKAAQALADSVIEALNTMS